MARGIRRTGAAGQPPLPRALTWLDLGYLASGPGTSALPVPTGMRYGSHMPNKEDLYDAAVDLFGDGKLEEAVARYDDVLAHTSLSRFYQAAGMVPEAEAEGARARVLDWKRQLKEEKPE